MGDCLAAYIKKQFDNANNNRKTTLDVKWNSNRDYFLGITDDKWKSSEGQGWRSTSFPGFTHQKCTYAACIIFDTVLAGGKLPFMYKGSPFERNRARSGGPVDPATINRAIEDMQKLTEQQLVDTKAEEVYMKNVLSSALYGWTYAKFKVHEVTRSGWSPAEPEVPGEMDFSRIPEEMKNWVKWEEKFMAPGVDYVPVWDIFRDWETDDLHACAFVGHRTIKNNSWLRSKKGKPMYIDKQIELAIENNKSSDDRANPTIGANSETENLAPKLRDVALRVNDAKYFEYWGRVPRKIVEQFEADMQADDSSYKPESLAPEFADGDEIEVMACTYNDEYVVRYARTLPEARPFLQAKWEDPGDELAPRGIADNCKQMHNVLKGTFRAIEDNTKLSANVIIALKERYLQNIPDEFKPGTKLLLTEDCDDARKALQSVTIPNVVGPLMQLLGVVQQYLDDDSMVPRLVQGIREPGDLTATEASMRQAAASKYIGMAIRNLDNGIVEPLVTKMYQYNMDDPEVTVGKGNYLVQALGFTSFQNRSDRQKALQLLLSQALASPELMKETKIRSIWEEIVKALDIDPDQALKSQAEKEAEAQEQAQSPETALQMQGAQAEVAKVESEVDKNKSQAVKNMADAEATKVEASMAMLQPPAQEPTMEPYGLNRAGETGATGLSGQQ